MPNVSNMTFEKFRVLIVDDNPVDRQILKAQLEDLGFLYIQEAQTGNEGIFKMENAFKVSKPFHLVVSDWKMPEKDGLTMLRELKRSGILKKTWIIMLTGVNDADSIKDAIAVGVDDFMIKPTDLKLLKNKLLKLTQQAAA